MSWFARRNTKQAASSNSDSGSNEVHTPENPYCDDLSCPCHTDVDYHDQVTSFSDSDDYDSAAYDYALSTLLA